MTRDPINWLRDALRFARRVSELIEPLDYDTYHATEFPRIGVERYLIALGDALRPALHHDPSLGARIPDARNAIDLRNFLTHAYMHIDDLVVWNVATTKLPSLIQDLETVIAERGQA
jgi:uncharacterized protein with HEPN domain